MHHKKAYVFDFDGTLVDSMDNFADIAGQIIADHYSVDYTFGKAKYIATSGLPFCEQIEIIFPKNPMNSQAVEVFEVKKLERYFEEDFYPDVAETINFLRSKGKRVIISSNNYQNVINEYISQKEVIFDDILGFREGFSKGTDHFNFIKKKYGFDAHELIFIGDSLKDAEHAYANNIDFIAKVGLFSHKDFKPYLKDGTRIINALKELKSN